MRDGQNKVAILTWWHYQNYGTALQVTALYNLLRQLGLEVDVVNYIPSGKEYATNKKADDEHNRNWEKYSRVKDEGRDKKYKAFLEKNITFTERVVTDEDFDELNKKYDFFIAGSDQIWSPKVFDGRYFLDFVRDNRRKASFAPSMSMLTIENEFVRERMRNLLSQIKHLSVREEHTVAVFEEELGIRNVEIMPDPTLLFDQKFWQQFIRKTKGGGEKFILCYFLGESENAWCHAEKISQLTGLPIKILPIFEKDAKHGEFIYNVGPEEFLELISDAEVVLTDSFHAVIFSIIFQRPFFAVERFKGSSTNSQNSRVYNLLRNTNLESRLICFDEKIRGKYDLRADFSGAKENYVKNVTRAEKFIKEATQIKNPLVSVIVPVYGVEAFIERGLRSLKNQTYKNIEVIVVDDGTKDSSGEVADKFARVDGRFKVIHKENGGVSSAKNTGIEAATGEYIMIMDGDDAVAPDYVEYFVGLIEKNNAEIAVSLNVYNESYLEQIDEDLFEEYDSDRALEGIYTGRIGVAMWNKIWRRSFIEKNKLCCRKDLWFSEGTTFCVQSFALAKKIVVGRRRVYWQEFFNPKSATRKFNLESWKNGFYGLEIQKKSWQKVTNSPCVKNAHAYHVWWNHCSVVRKIWLYGLEDEYEKEVAEYKNYIKKNWRVCLKIPELKDQWNFYEKISKNPKKYLLEINIEESKATALSEKLPWEISLAEKAEGRILELEAEKQSLQVENEKLRDEINHFMSIKRSAKLLAGNVKRRILRDYNKLVGGRNHDS